MRKKEVILIICEICAVIAKAWWDRETTRQHRPKNGKPAKRRIQDNSGPKQ